MDTQVFDEDEKIFVYDGPWLYSATVLNVSHDIDNRIKMYKIHYHEWSDDYDEEVKSDRILKINQETTLIKVKMDAQSQNTIHSNSSKIKRILEKEGKQIMFEKGARVIVFSEWLLHIGYVMDLKFTEGIYKYCIRYMQTKIHYEDWIKSGHYKVSKKINDEWLTSDRIFRYTDISVDIQRKLLKHRKAEDEDILQEYFNSQQKVCKSTQDAEEIQLNSTNDTIIASEDSNNSLKTLTGRTPKETTFLENLQVNSTMIFES